MNYDKNSFLSGLVTGMQLRGWHIGGGGSGGTGQCSFFPWAVDGGFPFSTPETYAAYVATIPAEQDSEDGFSWSPSLSDVTNIGVLWPGNPYYVYYLNSSSGFHREMDYNGVRSVWSAGGGGVSLDVTDPPPVGNTSRGGKPFGIYSLSFVAPVSGIYTLLGGTVYIAGSWTSLGGESFAVRTFYDNGGSRSGAVGGVTTFTISGSHLQVVGGDAGNQQMYKEIHCFMNFPSFWVKPAESVYDGIRASMVSGDLGVLHSGIAVRVFHGYVVDETAGTYTNPATGVTRSYASWTYNYPARRMVLNMGEGNPAITVTWGDYKMTILEGATEQVFYYML